MRWEYKATLWRWRGTWEEDFDKFLNAYGAAGWEVILCQPEQNYIRILMKRQAPTVHGEE